MEEPSCDNRPTSMHRCECHECTLVSPATLPHVKQINPILYRLLQKPSNFFTAFFFYYFFFYSAYFFFFCHTFPNYIYKSDCLKSPLVNVETCFFFFQAVILPTKTADNLLYTDKQTSRQTQIYRTDTKR